MSVSLFGDRRRGIIVINQCILEEVEQPRLFMAAVFKDIIVVRADNNVMMDYIEYFCYSEMFDEVPQGEIIPVYDVVLQSTYTAGKITGYERIQLRNTGAVPTSSAAKKSSLFPIINSALAYSVSDLATWLHDEFSKAEAEQAGEEGEQSSRDEGTRKISPQRYAWMKLAKLLKVQNPSPYLF